MDGRGGQPAVVDGVDHQGGALDGVAGGKDALFAGHPVLHDDVAAAVELHAELLDQAVVNHVQKTHRQEHQVGLDGELGAGQLLHLPAVAAADPVDPGGGKLAHPAAGAGKGLGQNAPAPLASFLVRAGGPQDLGPGGPGRFGIASLGRLRQDFDLVHRPGPLADRGAHAVAPGVAAADDHDVFVLGVDRQVAEGGDGVAGHAAVLLGEKIHGEVNALQVAAGDVERPRLAGPHRQADGVEHLPQVPAGEVLADVHARLELDPLGHHLLQAAVDDSLFQLEVGDAVAQKPPEAVVLLEDDHLVPAAGKLLGEGQAGRTGADHRHLPAGLVLRPNGFDPALFEGPFGNLVLDVLDGDRVVVDGQRARRFARRGADPPGDLREVVGGVQVVGRLAPLAAVDEVVELGDAVFHRAAGAVTEGDPAVHAAGGLLVEHRFDQRAVDLVPVADPLLDRAVAHLNPLEFQETRGINH